MFVWESDHSSADSLQFEKSRLVVADNQHSSTAGRDGSPSGDRSKSLSRCSCEPIPGMALRNARWEKRAWFGRKTLRSEYQGLDRHEAVAVHRSNVVGVRGGHTTP